MSHTSWGFNNSYRRCEINIPNVFTSFFDEKKNTYHLISNLITVSRSLYLYLLFPYNLRKFSSIPLEIPINLWGIVCGRYKAISFTKTPIFVLLHRSLHSYKKHSTSFSLTLYIHKTRAISHSILQNLRKLYRNKGYKFCET